MRWSCSCAACRFLGAARLSAVVLVPQCAAAEGSTSAALRIQCHPLQCLRCLRTLSMGLVEGCSALVVAGRSHRWAAPQRHTVTGSAQLDHRQNGRGLKRPSYQVRHHIWCCYKHTSVCLQALSVACIVRVCQHAWLQSAVHVLHASGAQSAICVVQGPESFKF